MPHSWFGVVGGRGYDINPMSRIGRTLIVSFQVLTWNPVRSLTQITPFLLNPSRLNHTRFVGQSFLNLIPDGPTLRKGMETTPVKKRRPPHMNGTQVPGKETVCATPSSTRARQTYLTSFRVS